MYSIAICDDDEKLCFYIEDTIQQLAAEKGKEIRTEIFFSGNKLYDYIAHGEFYDLIFLDIEMSEINGIEIGLKIREEQKNERLQIIYMSTFSVYALQLFKIHPLNFLIKPISPNAINENIERSIRISGYVEEKNTFEYDVRNVTHKEYLEDILYFSSQNREINIHLMKNTKAFYGTLKSIEKKLLDCNFHRIHKSYIVNGSKIKCYTKKSVTLINEEVLPISRGKQQDDILAFLKKEERSANGG